MLKDLCGRDRFWQWMATVGCLGTIAWIVPATAQLVPDATLGTENSVVTPLGQTDRIDGGAARGINLFHSFQQFNVGADRGVYFANPAGIENILSRVTGGSRSEILGRLGVLGNANLFLLNPNGIVFGANASLDITGSFTATTADAIALGNQGFFSATQPERSSLLAIAPGALFFDQQVQQPRTIQNSGNLTAGRDLTLSADNLELQGQVRSGGNLTLQAQDTLRIRDSVTSPFIAEAGGRLLVQGDRGIDIFALNHPQSGFFSGKDMTLRSSNAIAGDARFWSGGNFRIEQLDHSLGNLFSPADPIIRSAGDVRLNNYFGASLHILAGGSVTAGDIEIIDADPTSAIAETITLSNGTQVAIDGRTQPTLDIRAGIDPNKVGSPLGVTGNNGIFLDSTSFNLSSPIVTPTPTSSAINVNSIVMRAADGKVLLTNQYFKNDTLNGAIEIGNIRTDGEAGGFVGNSSSVVIDARDDLGVRTGIITTSGLGKTGDITVLVDGRISLLNAAQLDTRTFSDENAGNISIEAGSLASDNAYIIGGSATSGRGSSIHLKIRDGISLINGSTIDTRISGDGDAGDINIEARSLFLNRGLIMGNSSGGGDGSRINLKIQDSISLVNNSRIDARVGGSGSAGAFDIQARSLALDASFINNGTNGGGNGGNLNITSESISLTGGADVATATFGDGDAGDINIQGRSYLADRGFVIGSTLGAGRGGRITFNIQEDISLLDGSSIDTRAFADGDAAEINLKARSVLLNNAAFINNGTDGRGNGGNLKVKADSIFVGSASGIGTSVGSNGRGKGGELVIETGELLLRGGLISTGTFGRGDSGNVSIRASDRVEISNTDQFRGGIFTRVEPDALGRAGNVTIRTPELVIDGGIISSPALSFLRNGGNITLDINQFTARNNAEIQASTIGLGRGGTIAVTAKTSVQLDSNSSLRTSATGLGSGGRISISTRRMNLQEKSRITTDAIGAGNAGNIELIATEVLDLNNSAISAATLGVGAGGTVSIEAGKLSLQNGARIFTNALGTKIPSSEQLGALDPDFARRINAVRPLLALVERRPQRNSGDLTIRVREGVEVLGNSSLSTASKGQASAGNITIRAGGALNANNSDITTTAQSSGGIIDISARSILLTGDSNVRTNVSNGAGGNIILAADSILAFGDSDILAFAEQGKGGNITLNTRAFFGQNYRPAPPGTNPRTLDGNDRVDINASGTVSGAITLPDTTFIQNSLTQLAQNLIDSNTLLANSCIVRNRSSSGSFLITGSGGLPARPGDPPSVSFPTGEVRSLPTPQADRPWQPGDPIVEPQGIYRLANGKLVMGRECEP